MNYINVTFKEKENKYISIYKEIKTLITSNILKANESLPSKRVLASYLHVSKNTIMNAYNLLIEEGYIASIEKVNYYVLENRNYKKEKNNIILESKKDEVKYDFTSENIDSSIFPFYSIRKITNKVMLDHPEIYLKKAPSQGDILLRETIANYLYENKGMDVLKENIIIVSSLLESFKIISNLLNLKVIGLENPSYPTAYNFFKNKKIVLYPLDEKGINLSHIEPLDLIYVTPYNQFPSGIKMSKERVKELLNYPVSYIFEDDFDCDLINSNKIMSTIFSLNNEKVIFHGSFSHTFCPGIRISYLVLPNNLLTKYLALYANSSSQISSLDQTILTYFLKDGYYYRHIQNIKKSLERKRKIIREYLLKNKISFKESSLSFFIDSKIKNEHIRIHSLKEYYLTPTTNSFYILNYLALKEDNLIEALDYLLQ